MAAAKGKKAAAKKPAKKKAAAKKPAAKKTAKKKAAPKKAAAPKKKSASKKKAEHYGKTIASPTFDNHKFACSGKKLPARKKGGKKSPRVFCRRADK